VVTSAGSFSKAAVFASRLSAVKSSGSVSGTRWHASRPSCSSLDSRGRRPQGSTSRRLTLLLHLVQLGHRPAQAVLGPPLVHQHRFQDPGLGEILHHRLAQHRMRLVRPGEGPAIADGPARWRRTGRTTHQRPPCGTARPVAAARTGPRSAPERTADADQEIGGPIDEMMETVGRASAEDRLASEMRWPALTARIAR
jgi:hypothetical protein